MGRANRRASHGIAPQKDRYLGGKTPFMCACLFKNREGSGRLSMEKSGYLYKRELIDD